MVKLKIDGKDVQIKKGTTILAAAEAVGIKIPTLCYLKKISPTGACRVCVVEVSGADKPVRIWATGDGHGYPASRSLRCVTH